MKPSHIPGNEPDPGDMSVEPGMPVLTGDTEEHSLLEDEADTPGDFA
ncbi:hypothetical protein [Sphingomonas mucosissima]|uniref:Uncharacterized protein n=1 Tax=Sphingomonas mucosissima TaxID=370959 RepID=A0A245ZJ73_9SPHN|nr:hypothetical protein [Sphingomonas mucosissima]OWK29776.1 hypothetical protein SPMU_21970 [Sphingomonas mucosissima]